MNEATAAAKRLRVQALLQLAADEQCLGADDHRAFLTYLDRTAPGAETSPLSLSEHLDSLDRAYARANETIKEQAQQLEESRERETKLAEERDALALQLKQALQPPTSLPAADPAQG